MLCGVSTRAAAVARPRTADPDDLREFAEAWEAFFAAARRARGRTGSHPGELLTLPQYYLLAPLADGGSRPVGAVAEAAGVAQPTATRMLTALGRKGLVSRENAIDDRRVVSVSLTAAGRSAWSAKHARLQRHRAAVFSSLDEEERARGAAMLRRLAEVIECL